MSSKGQVVIPEKIRDKLLLAAGSQFIVIGEGDAIILKTLSAPSMKDFDRLILRARKQAKESGLKVPGFLSCHQDGQERVVRAILQKSCSGACLLGSSP